VFESIKSLRPHFHSLREIQNNVSLDIKLPLNWRYEDIIKPYRSITIKVQDKNEKFTLLSLISNATQDGYDVVFACASEIFKINKDEEEKQKLFHEKVKELQVLFKSESLDKLKELNLLDNYGQEDTTGIGDLKEGDGEGQVGDNLEQEEVD
jgi:DNA/RNA-binding domain of Phe-tRNA-synthetase-like protein